MQRKVILSAGALIFAATLLLQGAAARAADAVLDQMYGDGVHAFNIGDYTASHSALTDAISAGSKDPRAFYFRGLSYLRLGREQEAEADFTTGADLEVTDADRFYNVSKALARIQGPDRLRLEKKRAKARVLAFQARERQRILRYQEIREADDEVLLRPVPAPVVRPAAPAAVPPAAAVQPAVVPPVAAPDEEMPAEETAPADEPVEDDPFATPAEDAEAETVVEEVTEDSATTEEEMPAEEEAVEEDLTETDAEAVEEEPADDGATEETGIEDAADEEPAGDAAAEGEPAAEDADAETPADESDPFSE